MLKKVYKIKAQAKKWFSYKKTCILRSELVGNKANGRISKRVLQENEAHQKTCVCVSGGKKCSFFWKIWRVFFFCNTHFETHLFALLPTN